MAGAHLRTPPGRFGPRTVAVLAVALLVGFAVGFGGTALTRDTDVSVGASGAEEAEPSSPGKPAATGAAVAVPDPGPITIAFVGDINAEGSLGERLATDPAGFVGPFADVLRGADLAVANLEAALTAGGTPQDKDFVFRAPPAILDALRAGGIDVVTVANDHGLDFGPDGLAETIAVKRSQTDGMVIGAGADEDEAYAPYTAVVAGQRVAIIAATQVLDGEMIAAWTAQPDQAGLASAKRLDRLVEEVRSARADADTVVVYVHWGIETETCPDIAQQELARALVDAGADIVVGSHAHRLQGAGRLGGAFVAYGLGNFAFGALSEEGARTGVLLVEVDGREVLDHEWRPGVIVDRVPQPLDGDAAGAAVAAWSGLRACTDLEP